MIRERVGLNPALPTKRIRSKIVTMNEWKILEVLPDGYYEVQCPSCDKKICLNVQDRTIVKYCCCCGIRVNFRDQKKSDFEFRCDKCVYQCSIKKPNCSHYKRDPKDGGYYG